MGGVKEKEYLKSFSLINDENWASTYSDGAYCKTIRLGEGVSGMEIRNSFSDIYYLIYLLDSQVNILNR